MRLVVRPVDWLYSVYVIAAEKAVNVGYARNVARRLRHLQIGSPADLVVVDQIGLMTRAEAQAVERATHKALKDKCVRGEWFAVDPQEALEAIWRCMDNKVYVARNLATKDLRGYIEPRKWLDIATVAHKGLTNAETI
jgi:hypothetical protein